MFKSEQRLQEADQTNLAVRSITGQVRSVLHKTTYMQTA